MTEVAEQTIESSGEDSFTGKLLSREEATEQCFPTGVTQKAVWRWMKSGQKRRDGEFVKLHAIKLSGHLYTTREWVAEFIQKLAEK